MDRAEFELKNRDEAEALRQILEAKVPSGLKREDWKYANEKHGIDFYHVTFQKKGRRAGTYSYERSPNGVYVCILDLRELEEITINPPGKMITPNTLEFFMEEIRYLHAGEREIHKKFKERGYTLYPATGKHYPTFSFSHQVIAKGEKFIARYDQERSENEYVCHLDLDMQEYEQVKDLFQEWVQELFNPSEQKTPHHKSPQCAFESAK